MSRRSCHAAILFFVTGIITLAFLSGGCQKKQSNEAATPKQEAPPAPQTGSPAPPPAQLGKGSTDPAAQTGIPTEAKLNMQQGMNYLRSRDYGNAIKEFTLAIEKYPNYDTAYSNRAVAYMQQKKFNKAGDDLKKTVEINPKNPTAHYNLVALYSLQNQLDRAIDSLDRALELGFNNYDALRNDPDLNNVRRHPEFRKTLEKHKVFII
jgi:tetratricopeptide (TPR) repeat protein